MSTDPNSALEVPHFDTDSAMYGSIKMLFIGFTIYFEILCKKTNNRMNEIPIPELLYQNENVPTS